MLVPDDIEDLSKSLETMHVNVEFARTLTDLMEDVRAPGADQQALHGTMTDQEILCNISWPLSSLGVAFLQIDRWAEFDVEDVVTVRKAAKRSSSVSPKFRDLTQRCLDCDFGRGLGKDISKSGLQQAVCRRVLGELDTLISSTEEMSLAVPTDSEE